MADLIYALYLVGGYAVWLEVLHVFVFLGSPRILSQLLHNQENKTVLTQFMSRQSLAQFMVNSSVIMASNSNWTFSRFDQFAALK